nr:TIGR03364 family FAD-dependent oxidoreductase [Frankia sp. R43]
MDGVRADVVVVGAGIVGLAHAFDAHTRGQSVVVVERDDRAVGASVRNFGHGCVTAQSGPALDYALRARARWTQLGKDAGFTVREAGTLVLARHADELAVLDEFAQIRGDDVVLLDAAETSRRAPFAGPALGGAWFPLDLCIDARAAAGAIAAWLAAHGVRFHWNTAVGGIETGAVHTSRGTIGAGRTVVCVGHNVDRLFPDLAADHGVRRCALRMLRVRDPHELPIDPAILTGHSLLRYSGFDECPSLPALRDRIAREAPRAVEAGLNLMFTQRPDGSLTIGDTHDYALTPAPFTDERRDELVLAETARLLGVARLDVLERWRGVYASAPQPFLIAAPTAGVRVVSVTSGIGMTTALGLAPTVLDDLL